MDCLGSVKNVESVYYIFFGDLDSADLAIKADFETARNLSLLSFVRTLPKPCFKFKTPSPRIPLSAFECSGFKGLSEEPSVFLASRSLARSG